MTKFDVQVSPDHYIDGRRVSSGTTFEVTSPIDESHLLDVAEGGADAVDQAVTAAARAFMGWAKLGPEGRLPYLTDIANRLEQRADEFAMLECVDAGARYVWMRDEMMPRSAANFRFFAERAVSHREREWSSNSASNRVRHDPAGVVALITPWNAPLMLSTWKIGPALAAGCTVVVKPAEWAPLSNSLLADVADEVGLPPGVLNVVHGTGENTGWKLVNSPNVSRISFTGSVETARLIGQAAADRIVPVSFELGGKSPFIVCADADLDAAVHTATAQYHHAGQICLAGTRLLVDAEVADEFVTRFLANLGDRTLGDPRDEDTFIGPLITREHLRRVEGFVQRAKAAGCRVITGGRVSSHLGGLYYEPTLLADVHQEMEIVQREVFGPVLTFQTFANDGEAVALANNTRYGLAATVFTSDRDRGDWYGDHLTAGTTWINCYFVRDLSAPFGGCKASGIGREGGEWSFDFYSDVKTIVRR